MSDKEQVEKTDKPIFRLEDLKITPPRTPEQIKADIAKRIAEGRFAEMTPHQAGIDEELIPKEAQERIAAANKYFDENPPKAQSQAELDKLFKRN
jgi:hypothetical protein